MCTRFVVITTMLLHLSKGLPVRHLQLDGRIRYHIFALTHGILIPYDIVLAGTIVEGGPVYDRPRRILGGREAHSGLQTLRNGEKIWPCPEDVLTIGYTCKSWVRTECVVVRHLLHMNKLCSCKVDVC